MFELQSKIDSRSDYFPPGLHLTYPLVRGRVVPGTWPRGRDHLYVNSQCTHSCRIEIALSTLKSQVASYFELCLQLYIVLVIVPIVIALIDFHRIGDHNRPPVSLAPLYMHLTTVIKVSKSAIFTFWFPLTCILLLLTLSSLL